MTFLNETTGKWVTVYSSSIAGYEFVQVSVGSAVDPPYTPPPSPQQGGGTTHFTTFSVLLGDYPAEEQDDSLDSGGDGVDLGVILPAILVPVAFVVVVGVMLVALGSTAAVVWCKRRAVLGGTESAVNF